jgi:hypothetical protein
MRGTLRLSLTWQNKGTINLAGIFATNLNVVYDSRLFSKTSVLKCTVSALFVLSESQVDEIKARPRTKPWDTRNQLFRLPRPY